jgi:hypothetical protein
MPGNALEWSHDRVRTVVRADEVPPIPSVDTEPCRDPNTGRVGVGNRLHRRRLLKRRAEGIATLNPATCPTWLRPFVELGRPYVTSLVELLDGRPSLHPLAGSVADSHVMFRALTALALSAEGRDRTALLTEARGWLREHRTALATLLALAGDVAAPPDPDEALPWVTTRPEDAQTDPDDGPEEPGDEQEPSVNNATHAPEPAQEATCP